MDRALALDDTRAGVVQAFVQSCESISATPAAVKDGNRVQGEAETLIGRSGDNTFWGGMMAGEFRFCSVDAGTHRVMDLEGWDHLNFKRFGYVSAADARADTTLIGTDAGFEDQGKQVVLIKALLSSLDTASLIFL